MLTMDEEPSVARMIDLIAAVVEPVLDVELVLDVVAPTLCDFDVGRSNTGTPSERAERDRH
jgi:hypothetical protein